MKSDKHKNPEEANLKIDNPTELGAKLSACVILVTVVLLSLAYIADAVYSGGTTSAVGETFILSRLLLESGNLLSKLIYPLISAGIAFVSGGFGAIPAGLLGGMLAGTGATFESTNANATSISGVFGSILAGWIAGFCTKIISRIFSRYNGKENLAPFPVTPGIALIMTLLTVLLLNTASEYINHFASTLVGLGGKTNGVLLSVILGIFMTADSGGPLYLAGYTFGVASISTGEPKYMAMVIAAGAIPPLTMGLYTLIYKERTQSYERILGAVGIIGGLLGLPHSALTFYTKKTYRFLLSCVPGGIVAAMLSLAFNCSSEMPAGGLLSFSSFGRPLFFLLALSCGALLSTLLLSLTDGYDYSTATQNDKESFEAPKELSVQT